MKRVLLLLLLSASLAHAEIYTWTDSKGTKHYTNKDYEIPERYRAKAKVLDLGIVEKKEGTSPEQASPAQPSTPTPQIGPHGSVQGAPEFQLRRERAIRGRAGRRARSEGAQETPATEGAPPAPAAPQAPAK